MDDQQQRSLGKPYVHCYVWASSKIASVPRIYHSIIILVYMLLSDDKAVQARWENGLLQLRGRWFECGGMCLYAFIIFIVQSIYVPLLGTGFLSQ